MYGEKEEKITIDRKTFKTLASDTRVGLLKSLNVRRKTLSELSKEHRMSVSTIKEHLENLVGAELIIQKDDGHKWKYYELTRKGRAVLNPEERKIWILLSLSALAVIGTAIDAVTGIVSRSFSLFASNAIGSASRAPVFGEQDMITTPAEKAVEISTETIASTGGGELPAAAADATASAAQAIPWVHVGIIIVFAVIACYLVYRLTRKRKKVRI